MTTEGDLSLLVAIDHFNRFSILIPLKNKTVKSVDAALINDFFVVKFNVPKVIPFDNCSEFNNQIFKEACSKFQIKNVTSSPTILTQTEWWNAKTEKVLKICITL